MASTKKGKGKKGEDSEDLRIAAEKLIAHSPDLSNPHEKKSLVEIIHELQVYQIELELQNDELKKTHLKLEETRDEYIDLYDFSPVGYFTLTKEALISHVNLTGTKYLGQTRNKLIKARFRSFVVPEMYDTWDHFFLLLCSQNLKQITSLLLKRKDGTRIQTRIEGIPIQKEDKINELRLVVYDISDLKQAEERLAEANRYHRGLIEASIDPFVIINPDGKITDVNSASERITGCSRDILIGSPFSDYFIEPEKKPEGYNKVFKEGQIRDCYLEVRNTRGIIIPAIYNASVYKDASEKIQGAFVAIRDITELRQAETALHETNQKLRVLAGITHHDIFNQLSIMMGYNELIMETPDSNVIQKYVSNALKAGLQMKKIIEFTQEYEKSESISNGWLPVHEIIESARSEMSLGNVIISNLISNELKVFADPILIKVFSTFIENALRHGEKISKIVFTTNIIEKDLILIYFDDGIGIPEKEKENIFTYGFGKHTGIGLFLSRKILSIAGFSIRECGEEGIGTRFEIIVPSGKYIFSK